jgi:hypothetical protein
VESASRRLVTRVYLEHVALRAVEPGNDDELSSSPLAMA